MIKNDDGKKNPPVKVGRKYKLYNIFKTIILTWTFLSSKRIKLGHVRTFKLTHKEYTVLC